MRIITTPDCRTRTAERIEKLCEPEEADLPLGGDDVAHFGPVLDAVYVDVKGTVVFDV